MKKALITGITGQDGSFLAELLLEKGYSVYGVVRRSSTTPKSRIEHLYVEPHNSTKLFLEYGDLSDGSSLRHLLSKIQPDEVYNLAAQSHVRISFDQPEYTNDVTGMGVLRILEAIKEYQTYTGKEVKFYQASSSEMYGDSAAPQDEDTPFRPRSPYAIAKTAAYWHTVNYREAYNMFCCNGILFNHESERRGENFVTRKITRAATRIKLGLQDKLFLGNLDAKRDWGYAKDYVEAMWLMLQQDEPDDYVVATGKTYSVKDFLVRVFEELDLDWEKYVEIDSYYYRPTEVNLLLGNADKAQKKLNWVAKTDLQNLVKIMVDHDLYLAEKELHASKFKEHDD